ncbi:hypothetical protein [Caudoviricetes sp.]|nr:hypothetical protein [Caudoviricetes sp.]
MALLSFGGTTNTGGPRQASQADINASMQDAQALTAQTPEERALLDRLREQYSTDDARVLQEMEALRGRGERLGTLDEAFFQRAWEPAFKKLMDAYQLADREIMEDMNRRGIVSQGTASPEGVTAGSDPEAYQRALLSRETKEQMGRSMMSAQNQAQQQAMDVYNARLAEMGQANTRREQTFGPLANATIVPESERMQTRAGTATNLLNTRLGHTAQMHQINTQRKIAGQEMMMGALGSGVGAAGAAIGAMAMSDVRAKKNFDEFTPEDTEGLMNAVRKIGLSKWNYNEEPDGSQRHLGGVTQDMPDDVVRETPQGEAIDIPSYLGMLTAAIQNLDRRVRGQGFKSLQPMIEGGM